METKELLDILKLIKGVRVAAHDMTNAHLEKAVSYTAWYNNGELKLQDSKDKVRRFTDKKFIKDYEFCQWQVKIEVHNLMKLVSRKKVDMVEAAISGGGFSSTHRLYMDGKTLYDEGCDGEELETNTTQFEDEYPNTWWKLDQVTTAESMIHN